MISVIKPVNNITDSNSVTSYSSISSFKQAQDAMQSVAQLVYQSMSMLTVASEKGITKEGLTNFKTLLENENMTDKNAYKLVNTMLQRFSALSSNGDTITESDLTSAIKFSVAQTFSHSRELTGLFNGGALKVSPEIEELYGYETAKTIAIVQFLDSLSQETLSNIVSNINNAKTKSTIKPESYYGRTEIQDYRTVTSAQLRRPFNIAV